MPIIKSAIKKMRVDAKRRAHNIAATSRLRTALKKARAEKSFAAVSEAYSALDKAVKTNLVKKGYANRHKANLAKLAKPTKLVANEKPVIKKVAVKTRAKKTSAAKPKKS